MNIGQPPLFVGEEGNHRARAQLHVMITCVNYYVYIITSVSILRERGRVD